MHGYAELRCGAVWCWAVMGCAPTGVEWVGVDLLGSSLADVGLLLMTNQCWDRELMEQVGGWGGGRTGAGVALWCNQEAGTV